MRKAFSVLGWAAGFVLVALLVSIAGAPYGLAAQVAAGHLDVVLPSLAAMGAFHEINSPNSSIIAPGLNTGAGTGVQLIKAVRTFALQLRLRLTATLAGGPATAINNGGSPWAVFNRVGIDENGAQNIAFDPLAAVTLTQMFAPRDTDKGRTRLTLLADGAYNLEESIFIPFSGVQTAGPAESIFMERDVRRDLKAFVNQDVASGVGRLVRTPGTCAISNVSVSVSQRYDVDRQDRTILLPVIRDVELSVNGASTEFPFKIDSVRYLQGMIIRQITDGAGEVDDIISALALRADNRDIIGPGLKSYEEAQADAQMIFPGDVVPRGTLPVWFRQGGRLSNVLNPNTMSNLKFVFNVAPSVTAGATNSRIRITLLELERVEGLTVDPKGWSL